MKNVLFLAVLAVVAYIESLLGMDESVLQAGPLGLLAAAASAGMGVAANRQSQRAMEEDVNAELKRQEGYQQRSDAPVRKLIDVSNIDTMNKETAEGSAHLSDLVGQVAAKPLSFAPRLSESSSTVGANRSADAQARSTQNFSNLGGYYNWLLNQNIRQDRSAQELETVGRLAGISNSILPMELERSSHVGDGLRDAAQVVGAAPSIAGAFAAMAPKTTAKPKPKPGALSQGNVPFSYLSLGSNGLLPLSQIYADALNPLKR